MSGYDPCKFSIGTRVRIADRATLDEFIRMNEGRHFLEFEQLLCAGQTATIADTGVYHGGTPVYRLEGMPRFIWYEKHLEPLT